MLLLDLAIWVLAESNVLIEGYSLRVVPVHLIFITYSWYIWYSVSPWDVVFYDIVQDCTRPNACLLFVDVIYNSFCIHFENILVLFSPKHCLPEPPTFHRIWVCCESVVCVRCSGMVSCYDTNACGLCCEGDGPHRCWFLENCLVVCPSVRSDCLFVGCQLDLWWFVHPCFLQLVVGMKMSLRGETVFTRRLFCIWFCICTMYW